MEQNWAWEILLSRLDAIRPAPGKNEYAHVPGIWVRALKEIWMQFDKIA
jgi:hypothetical protein